MIVKPAKYKNVKETVRRKISNDVYGCDCCKKEFSEDGEIEKLSITVFQNHKTKGSEGEHYDFCSWNCVAKFMKTVKCNYFVTLPYVSYDNKTHKNTGYKALLEIFKPKP